MVALSAYILFFFFFFFFLSGYISYAYSKLPESAAA